VPPVRPRWCRWREAVLAQPLVVVHRERLRSRCWRGFGGAGFGGGAFPTFARRPGATVRRTVLPTALLSRPSLGHRFETDFLSPDHRPELVVNRQQHGLPAYVPLKATAPNGHCVTRGFTSSAYVASPTSRRARPWVRRQRQGRRQLQLRARRSHRPVGDHVVHLRRCQRANAREVA